MIELSLDRTFTDLRIWRALNAKDWCGNESTRVLIVSEKNRISSSQIFPFHYYSQSLKNRWGVELRQIDIADMYVKSTKIPSNTNIIFYQPWFQYHSVKNMIRMIDHLKQLNQNAKIVFFDAYAPLDLRLVDILNPLVDLYVKKHVFRDKSRYGVATQGDTNLVDFYEKLYGLRASPEIMYPVSQNFLSRKLIVGPSFFTSREMLTTFISRNVPLSRNKKFGVHARLGVKGVPWYQAMREQALLACQPFDKGGVVTFENVKNHRYLRELEQSKICFSPFGYGEVCWRDYESILCGALLVKPDMSHVETVPDTFIPYETYVPIAWDFSDLSEKLDYYLANDAARQRIVNQAYDNLHTYTNSDAFLDHLEVIFNSSNK